MSKMTNDEFVGRLIAFRGDDEYIPASNVLLEITEVENGNVEVAFNMPVKGGARIYVSIPIAELVARATAYHQE